MAKEETFKTEADLCRAFIADATRSGKWTAYAETGGFDIVLVRNEDGFQVGIEAKLKLNAKVIEQAIPDSWYDYATTGPDCRAVLVPADCSGGLSFLCCRLGIVIIRQRFTERDRWREYNFNPELPVLRQSWGQDKNWPEWAPEKRVKLPDVIPDCEAGHSAPVQLTEWKVKALRLCVILEERPVTRADFKALQLDPGRWTQFWLARTERGWIQSDRMPDFRKQHPVNYEQIKADKKAWMKVLGVSHQPAPEPYVVKQGELL